MLEGFTDKVKGYIVKPAGTFRTAKPEPLAPAFVYYLVLLVINAVLSGIVVFAGLRTLTPLQQVPGIGLMAAPVVSIAIIVLGILGVFIGGAWVHLWVWLLGGRKGYEQTVKAIMYGNTPYLLLGWIPLVGIIFGIWSLVLEILGIRELQEISTGRAVAAVLLAIIVLAAVIGAIVVSYLYIPASGVHFTSPPDMPPVPT